MLGPYIKSRGSKCTKMSANADLITVETYVQQGETILKPVFHIRAKMWKIWIFWAIWGVLRGCSMIRLGLSCFPAILSPISMYMSNKEVIWKEILKFKPKIWKKYTFFSYLGGPGEPLRQTQVNKNFRAVRPHHRTDICITREKNNHQFFIYGPQYKKMCILGYSGGPGWPINNWTGPILLPSYPLTYINLHIKYGSNPIRIF